MHFCSIMCTLTLFQAAVVLHIVHPDTGMRSLLISEVPTVLILLKAGQNFYFLMTLVILKERLLCITKFLFYILTLQLNFTF